MGGWSAAQAVELPAVGAQSDYGGPVSDSHLKRMAGDSSQTVAVVVEVGVGVTVVQVVVVDWEVAVEVWVELERDPQTFEVMGYFVSSVQLFEEVVEVVCSSGLIGTLKHVKQHKYCGLSCMRYLT